MALLDDLKGILSPEEYAKIEGNAALKTRAQKADELYSYYVGEETTTATTTTAPPTMTTPVHTTAPPSTFDLGGIERMLDAKLGDITKTIDTKLEAAVKTRGDELVNNAVKIALQRNDELNRLYSRHERVTGKEFDSADFNTFLEKPENKGRFRNITEAGDVYLAPAVNAKTIAEEVDKQVKARTGQSPVPGGTPAPSTNKTIAFFTKRSVAGDPGGTTSASRAAALLDRRAATEQQAAS